MDSLINLGDIGKPADTLIKKVSSAVGGLFQPYQIKRVAKAEAEASIIKAQGEIQITELHRRAMHRFVEEEAVRQKNIEGITNKALPQLDAGADASKVEDDWVTNFFEKSRIVSDSEMQDLWAKVLAGEANKPGSYSKRTVNFLGDLDKYDAEIFSNLCSFQWKIGYLMPLVFDNKADIYSKKGINFNELNHLETIGLIKFNTLGFQRIGLPKRFTSYYGETRLPIELAKDDGNDFPVGQVLLTKIGEELAPICGNQIVDGFFDYVREQWKAYLPKQPESGPNAAKPA